MFKRRQKDSDKTENEKQASSIYTNEQNIYNILNPQILPQLSQQKKDEMKQILKSENYQIFKKRLFQLAKDEWKQLQTLTIHVKQTNKQTVDGSGKQKYQIQFIPKYQRFSLQIEQKHRIFELIFQERNVTLNRIKNISLIGQWYYNLKKIDYGLRFSFYSPWEVNLYRGRGQPIDNKYVVDSRTFGINYILNDVDREHVKGKGEKIFSSFFMEMKGYSPRLRNDVRDRSGYHEGELLRKNDFMEIGYWQKNRYNNEGSQFQCSLGTDFYRVYYWRVRGMFMKKYWLSKNISFVTQNQFGWVNGVNLTPHKMFHGFRNRWMGERYRSYFNERISLCSQIWRELGLKSSNYLNLWVGNSVSNKMKLEVELGINLNFSGLANFDIALMKIKGEKGVPKFGIKFDF